MIFWPKLLTVAHAYTTSVHPFLALFYYHVLQLNIQTISIVTAIVLLLRVPSTIFWIDLVDKHASLHGVFTGLLTALGTGGILLGLSVPPTWTSLILPAVIISCIMDGLFYQPLEVMVDSAIIKMLGDFKTLYGSQRQWGKVASAVMTIVIGWFLDNDHDFDTLMVNILIGSVVLFLLSLSTTVNADPDLIREDEHSPLNNARQASFGSTKKKSGSVAYCYTPYRLFREPLSHISEEEDNVVQRVQTTNSTTRPLPMPPRPESANSNVSTTLSIMTTTNISAAPDHVNSCIYCLPPSLDSGNRMNYFYTPNSSSMYLNHRADTLWLSSSFDLAQLPCPPLSSSVLTLGLLVPRHQYNSDLENCYPPPGDFEDDDQDDSERGRSRHCFSSFSSSSHQGQWNQNMFLFSFFCTGIAFGMIQTLSLLYMHHVLLLPMHFIGFIGSVMIFSEILANVWIQHVTERYSPSFVTKFAHISLITTTLLYTWLQPNTFTTKISIILLQCIQAFSFHFIWLLSIRHIDGTIESNYKRMILKGSVATLCSSLGPALGVMITGYIVNNHSEGYKLVYEYAAGVIALGALSSWEWPILD